MKALQLQKSTSKLRHRNFIVTFTSKTVHEAVRIFLSIAAAAPAMETKRNNVTKFSNCVEIFQLFPPPQQIWQKVFFPFRNG